MVETVATTPDYYNELEVERTATKDEIKKAYKKLAIQYHPDRHPGKESVFVAKFQELQAAYDVLKDPEKRRKYDQEQDKLKANTPSFPRRGPVPPPPPGFPPPPSRTKFAHKTNQSADKTTQRKPPTSAYTPYATAGQREAETKNEGKAGAFTDAFRGFQQMRPEQSPTGERFVPRYPTAQRPTSFAHPSAGPAPFTVPRSHKSWDEFRSAGLHSAGKEPSPGFPGLSRTQSARKKQGYTDEPAPKSSAYATHSRSYFPESWSSQTPQTPLRTPQTPLGTRLRHARSSPVAEEGRESKGKEPLRPGLERVSTRYSKIGGERTDVTSGAGDRFSRARNHEHENDGLRHGSSHEARSRHRSSSRNLRPKAVHDDSSSSDLYSSTDDDLKEQKRAARPRSTPRKPPLRPGSTEFKVGTPSDGHDQFPGTKYVKPRDADNTRFPPAPPPRASFKYVPGHSTPRATVNDGYVRPGEATNGPNMNGHNMYAPFPFYPREWSKDFRLSPSRLGKCVPSLNGFPSWAVPSSVLPRTLPRTITPKKKHSIDTIREEKRDRIEGWRSDASRSTFAKRHRKHGRFTDAARSDSSSGTDTNQAQRSQPSLYSASLEDVNKTFSASEWNDRFASGEDLFRPPLRGTHRKRSPARPGRSRGKPYNKAQASPFKESSNEFFTSVADDPGESSTTSESFGPVRYSDEKWAEKLRYVAPFAVPKSSSTLSAPEPHPTASKPVSPSAEVGATGGLADDDDKCKPKADDVDPMDIDDSFPSRPPSSPSTANVATTAPQRVAEEKRNESNSNASGSHAPHEAALNVNIEDLSNVAPLRASDTGLGDLTDLTFTLPFGSKASPARPSQIITDEAAVSSLKALNLPKPPKAVIPPLETMSREIWTRYSTEMSAYMHDWCMFNKKMLDHFQGRQAQLGMTLMPQWMSALGDGPSGEEMNRKVQGDSSMGENRKAGYAAYRQWLEEDMRVREWWNVACEKHRQAIIDLGKVREMAKSLAKV